MWSGQKDFRFGVPNTTARVWQNCGKVSVSYGGRTICEPVSFVLKQGERIALQGVNGCGKSSLLRLLMGQAVPHSGTVVLSSGVRVSYVGQETDVPVGTLADYARAQGVEEHRFKAILRKMGFSRAQLERDASCFSTGERRKVLLAASLCQQAHLYLWDEPLNYIDVFSRMQIEELLLEAAPSLLFVEHDTAFVNRVATGVFAGAQIRKAPRRRRRTTPAPPRGIENEKR